VTALLATLVGLALAAAVLVVVKATGQSHLARQLANVGGIGCLVLFVLINVSDWPGGFLNQFWTDHAIVGATVGTLLLAATVFLIYRFRDQQQQDLVDESIVDAGRTELVERLFEVDVALTLIHASTEPDLCHRTEWQRVASGLDWLKEHLGDTKVVVDGSWAELDTRLRVHAQRLRPDEWRLPVLDEAVRRVADGVREWGPILLRSRAGELDLVAFANVRVVLEHFAHRLQQGERIDEAAADLQHVVRRFARVLVVDEQTPQPRAKLLVPAFVEELAAHPMTTKDEVALNLLERIERHVESRVRVEKRRRRLVRQPAASTVEQEMHAQPLDASIH
jgi:hypothetical protein